MEPSPSYDETVKKGPFRSPPTYEELFPVREMTEQVRQACNNGTPVAIPETEQVRQARNNGTPVAIPETEQVRQARNNGIPVAIPETEQVRQAHNNGTPVAFFKHLYFRLRILFIFSCCIVTLTILPISMIIIGSIYVHKCTIQDKIPIFLIIFGCTSLLETTFGLLRAWTCRNDFDVDIHKRKIMGLDICGCLTTFVLIAWLWVGCYYSFRNYDKWVHEGKLSCSAGGASNLCCDPVLMYFSYVCYLFVCFMPCAGVLCACVCYCLVFMWWALHGLPYDGGYSQYSG